MCELSTQISYSGMNIMNIQELNNGSELTEIKNVINQCQAAFQLKQLIIPYQFRASSHP